MRDPQTNPNGQAMQETGGSSGNGAWEDVAMDTTTTTTPGAAANGSSLPSGTSTHPPTSTTLPSGFPPPSSPIRPSNGAGSSSSDTNGSPNGAAARERDRTSTGGGGATDDEHLPVDVPTGLPWPGESDVERGELVRLLVAGLREIGYGRAATTLELESGYALDPHPDVSRFRDAVLSGKWTEADRLLLQEQDALLGNNASGGGGGGGTGWEGGSNGAASSGSVAAGAGRRQLGRLGIKNIDDLREARFLIAQQKYLELLEGRHVKTALSVLRTEVTPLAQEAAAAAAAAATTASSSASMRALSIRSGGSGGTSRSPRRRKSSQQRRDRRRRLLPGSWEVGRTALTGTGARGMALDDDDDGDEDEDDDMVLGDHHDGSGSVWTRGEAFYEDDDLDGFGADHDDADGLSIGGGDEASEEDESGPLQRLSVLSSFLMCGSPQEVRDRSGWQGVAGGTRVRVLDDMQALIPPSHLLPHHRLPRLLEQAKLLQRTTCLYHVSDVPVSLLSDHSCPRDRFPSLTTHVLREHTDEVWRVEWHPAGDRLATAGADKKCLVWKMQDRQTGRPARFDPASPSGGGLAESGEIEFVVEHALEGHPTGVAAIAWSPDGSALLTASDCTIKIWNTEDGKCICSMTKHDYEVSALAWLPDGKTFVSGAMDQTVHAWSLTGDSLWSWTAQSTRILDIAVTPDGRHLVAVGLSNDPVQPRPRSEEDLLSGPAGDGADSVGSTGVEGVREKTRRVLVYDLIKGKAVGMYNHSREITCVSVSSDSKYALINTSPDEVQLFSLDEGRVVQQYVGQKQGRYVIKSCFGGAHGNFILSGSEDGMVYAWHRETAQRIDVLRGHKPGTVVNAVAWNPAATAMFASAGDDHTVRIWQGEAAALPPSMSDVL